MVAQHVAAAEVPDAVLPHAVLRRGVLRVGVPWFVEPDAPNLDGLELKVLLAADAVNPIRVALGAVGLQAQYVAVLHVGGVFRIVVRPEQSVLVAAQAHLLWVQSP